MTTFTSLFFDQGYCKIVEKIDKEKTIPLKDVLKIGKLTIVKKGKKGIGKEKTFLMTSKYLLNVSNSIKKDSKAVKVYCKARIELNWLLLNYFTDSSDDKEGSPLLFHLIKADKIIRLKAINHIEFENWRRLLTKYTIQQDFFERFDVVSVMGKGSSALVYKIRETATGEQFACKRFKKSSLDKGSRKNLIKEINILRELKGEKHIVELHHVFESENSIYLIMELCEGKRCTLRNTLYQPKQMISLAYQILKALKILKDKRIIHKDLKPDNILLKYEDKPIDENEIRIVDFGLAVYSFEDNSKRRGGTVAYMAPEYLNDPHYIPNTKYDIYALGVVLYNGLTGKKLFKGKTDKCMVRKNKEGFIDFTDSVIVNLSDKGEINRNDSFKRTLSF